MGNRHTRLARHRVVVLSTRCENAYKLRFSRNRRIITGRRGWNAFAVRRSARTDASVGARVCAIHVH